MLSALFSRCTPRTSSKTQLLIAACVWTGVGLLLTTKGLCLVRYAAWSVLLIIMAGGICLGILKGKFVLDPVASKIITRLQLKNTPSCLGGLFSIRNWLLILAMIVMGKILGTIPLAATIKAMLYTLVGIGLIYSSRLMWIAWQQAPASLNQGSK